MDYNLRETGGGMRKGRTRQDKEKSAKSGCGAQLDRKVFSSISSRSKSLREAMDRKWTGERSSPDIGKPLVEALTRLSVLDSRKVPERDEKDIQKFRDAFESHHKIALKPKSSETFVESHHPRDGESVLQKPHHNMDSKASVERKKKHSINSLHASASGPSVESRGSKSSSQSHRKRSDQSGAAKYRHHGGVVDRPAIPTNIPKSTFPPYCRGVREARSGEVEKNVRKIPIDHNSDSDLDTVAAFERAFVEYDKVVIPSRNCDRIEDRSY